MTDISAAAFVALVRGRRGHFGLESGHHGGLWLDLDALFANQAQIDPFVSALANILRPYSADIVCGPLLGGAFLAQLVARELGAEFCFTERVPSESASTTTLYSAQYRLPPAFVERVSGKRVAMVDDVMSAGSALRGTYSALQACEAVPVVAASLLQLGTVGAEFFARAELPVEAVARDRYELWPPAACPLCASGAPLEEVSLPTA
jgi:orotate phosphoribosyltransferase